jgi:hypothetical protein
MQRAMGRDLAELLDRAPEGGEPAALGLIKRNYKPSLGENATPQLTATPWQK